MPVIPMSLRAFAHLRHLTIDFSLVHGSSVFSLFTEAGENIIPSLTSPLLRTLQINFPLSNITTSLNPSAPQPQRSSYTGSGDDYRGIFEHMLARLSSNRQFENVERFGIQFKHEGAVCAADLRQSMGFILERHEKGRSLPLRVGVQIVVAYVQLALITNLKWELTDLLQHPQSQLCQHRPLARPVPRILQVGPS